ncbi:MAG TPA: class I SAM-dependent methyltransferase [Anaerolineae bacterium]|nr:class I SAM-dependent methyltransferase [Anaerolineae bacterium]
MDHQDHVNLLRDGVPTPGGVWADLGSGTGAFTLALAQLINPAVPQSSGLCPLEIYSIDRDAGALRTQKKRMSIHFPHLTVHYLTADFTRPLDLPPLDGIVMANSLHFVRDKDPVLHLLRGYLRPGGRLLIVEYDTDRGNAWVPHPISYETWSTLAARAGLVGTRLLHIRPSRFLGRIYSALSLVDDTEHAQASNTRPGSRAFGDIEVQSDTEIRANTDQTLRVSPFVPVYLCVTSYTTPA